MLTGSLHIDELFARRRAAMRLERQDVIFLDGTKPLANCCHDNAERFAREQPGHRVVRGWLIISATPDTMFVAAHSILADLAGALFDITPMPPDAAPLFLEHRRGGDLRQLESALRLSSLARGYS